MDRSKRDLEAPVASQKEQLTRYEKRLKVVVAAYKGLLKEKEALEVSLALTANPTTKVKEDAVVDKDAPSSAPEVKEVKNQLQMQILTPMNSLAMLSAEKSRLEASFQADKKQLRSQLAQSQAEFKHAEKYYEDEMRVDDGLTPV